MLPTDYQHEICEHQPIDDNNFRSVIRMTLTTETEVEKWLEEFQQASSLTWRKSKTYPDSGRYNRYRVRFIIILIFFRENWKKKAQQIEMQGILDPTAKFCPIVNMDN